MMGVGLVINGELRYELVDQLGVIKSLLKDSVKEHEISQDMRLKIMGKIGEIKSILYSDLEFKKGIRFMHQVVAGD